MEHARQQPDTRRYYSKRAVCYRQAYSRGLTVSLVDNYYRIAWFPLRRIYGFTMRYFEGAKPQRILDVGCGTGAYAVEMARRGHIVTALDSCKEMIEATESLLSRCGPGINIRMVLADYIQWSQSLEEEFDRVLAIGIMDSVRDAASYLISFRRVAGEVVLTFPAKSVFSPITEFSYRRQGIIGYSYTRQHVEELLEKTGFKILHFKKIFPGTYWVHARRVEPEPGRI